MSRSTQETASDRTPEQIGEILDTIAGSFRESLRSPILHSPAEAGLVLGSLRYIRSRPDTRDMTIGLFSRCVGGNARTSPAHPGSGPLPTAEQGGSAASRRRAERRESRNPVLVPAAFASAAIA